MPNTTSREDELREEGSLVKNRVAGVEGPTRSPEPPSGSYKANPWPDQGRHSAQLSIGNNNPITRDVGGQQQAIDKDFLRKRLGPKQLLYDPYKDTIPGEGSGKDHEESSGRAGFQTRPSLEESPLHGRLNSVNMEGGQLEQNLSQGRFFMHHTKDSLNEKHSVNLEQGRRTSPDCSPPVGDCATETQDSDPEMLLQPETRPISHDQLVIEVKGIYAGLVMVEAKCIDIDEKQTAAAQEKDLAKKTQLKNDQWQSLIALHKQVGTNSHHKLPFENGKRVAD